ncbi:tetratricopeptide repeat protein [Actinopolymorpha alba]|uniref:tetratricopeptide repeat protein n=1 Tax=Actinopolymorpha alba TaxID=533267 RepID=UPI0003A2FF5A|nr:tetratricopeptide repeat protein [Actinopolymorpha alba]
MTVDYYELLEVAPRAAPEEIRAAITRQRRIWVRRQSSPDPERRTHAEQRVRDIDAAERTLLDPAARRAYDDRRARERRSGAQPSASSQSPGGSPTRSPASSRPPASSSPSGPAASGGGWGSGRSGSSGSGTPDPVGAGPRGVPRHDDLDDHLDRAERYFQQGRWRLAEAEFEYVLQRSPDHLGATTGLGAVHAASGRVKEGLAVLEQAVADHPDDEDVKLALATALYETAIAGLSEVGSHQRSRPIILSRRQLRLVKDHLRRLRRLGLSDGHTRMYVEELKDLLAEARKAVWVRSGHLRYYAIPFIGAVVMAFLTDFPAFRVMGYFWMAVIAGVYVVRHRQPGWKYHRRETGSRGRARTLFRKGL